MMMMARKKEAVYRTRNTILLIIEAMQLKLIMQWFTQSLSTYYVLNTVEGAGDTAETKTYKVVALEEFIF